MKVKSCTKDLFERKYSLIDEGTGYDYITKAHMLCRICEVGDTTTDAHQNDVFDALKGSKQACGGVSGGCDGFPAVSHGWNLRAHNSVRPDVAQCIDV